MGRARSASAPPATARAIATAPRAASGVTAVMSWTCFRLFASCTRNSWSGRTGAGASPASTPCHRNAISGSASARRVTSARSAAVDARRTSVSGSSISAALPSTDRYPWRPSSGRSHAGSRAARRYPRGASATADSTKAAGKRTRSPSTRAPAAASRARTLGEPTTTPVSARTRSDAPCTAARASGVSGRREGASSSARASTGWSDVASVEVPRV